MAAARCFQLRIDAPLMVGRLDKLGRMVGHHLSVLVSQDYIVLICFMDHLDSEGYELVDSTRSRHHEARDEGEYDSIV